MNWYCLHTKSQKELQVDTYCRQILGVETYYPQLRRYCTVRRVRRLVVGPLFPRYMFCRFDLACSYRAVRYAPEALDIVRFGGSPAVVEDALIQDLKQWAGESYEAGVARPALSIGEGVEITTGPLRGLTAVILHANDDQDRVAILLSLLKEGAKLTISREWLKPLASVTASRPCRAAGSQLASIRPLVVEESRAPVH